MTEAREQKREWRELVEITVQDKRGTTARNRESTSKPDSDLMHQDMRGK